MLLSVQGSRGRPGCDVEPAPPSRPAACPRHSIQVKEAPSLGEGELPPMSGSARVIFDDVLLANHRLVELVAHGHALEGAGQLLFVDLEPAGLRTAFGAGQSGLDEGDL